MAAAPAGAVLAAPTRWVIDTNRVLDLWLFDDPALRPWRAQLCGGTLTWLACARMRAELAHVLGYTSLRPWLLRLNPDLGAAAAQVLLAYDRWSTPVAEPVHQPGWPRCRDTDDQVFIDLALTHNAALLSKDRDVLRLRRRLRALGLWVDATPPI